MTILPPTRTEPPYLKGAGGFPPDEDLDPSYFGLDSIHVYALIRRSLFELSTDQHAAYRAARRSARAEDPDQWDAAVRRLRVFTGQAPAPAESFDATVALALVRRHELGAGITQEDYDLVTAPWRAIFGPIHPDDGDDES